MQLGSRAAHYTPGTRRELHHRNGEELQVDDTNQGLLSEMSLGLFLQELDLFDALSFCV